MSQSVSVFTGSDNQGVVSPSAGMDLMCGIAGNHGSHRIDPYKFDGKNTDERAVTVISVREVVDDGDEKDDDGTDEQRIEGREKLFEPRFQERLVIISR